MKEKILKAAREKKHLTYEEKIIQMINTAYQRQRRPGGSGTMFLNTGRKELSTMESVSGKAML